MEPPDRDNHHTDNAISGTSTGSVVQAANIHGDVYFANATPPGGRIVPRQLHSPPEHFTNRNRELGELSLAVRNSSRSGPCVVVLRGAGGVGKTALALRWLAQIGDRFPAGQLYAELTQAGGQPVPVEDVLGGFLRALGVQPEHVPVTLAERATLFRSLTATKPLAVLLDDVCSSAQVRALLPGSPESVVVATSRRPLVALMASGAVAVPVNPLEVASSVDLLASYLGAERVRDEQEHAEALADLCGGLPIALCVSAALILSRPRRSLGWMVERLRDEHRRLDVLSVEDDYSVRAAFDLAYRDLPEPAAAAYRALGLHPGALVSPELVAAATGLDLDRAAEAIDDLLDASLLDEPDDGWHRLHNLVRVHARVLGAARDDATDVLRRIVDWHVAATRAASRTVMPARPRLPWDRDTEALHPPQVREHRSALDWLEQVRGDLVLVMRAAFERRWFDTVTGLGYAMLPLFILHKHHVEAVEVLELALDAAIESGDAAVENKMRKRLARTLTELGEYDQAEHHIGETLRAARDRGDRAAESSARKSLAMLHRARGRHVDVIAEFEAALATMRQGTAPRAVGLLLTELGKACVAAGQVERAVEHLAEARAVLSGLPDADPYNHARVTLELGRARLRLGEHTAAGDLLRSALVTLAAQDAEYETAQAHRALAQWSRVVADPDGERRHIEEAEAILDRLGLGPAAPS
ncbi:NB-ARC domain-containing protein [Actinokineospora iranica]|uniref:NB-ARC domain-containing protein n=1 Tax=Actinokineospora iranica TaxID=1271860 RepID=A0A1G6QG98_9PSEU|nr:NB-ARC domain-containing protein [Actinokineospora iranica]SDC91500.1 NB-ARC domain-containing protein [Actinokineospora iranica]